MLSILIQNKISKSKILNYGKIIFSLRAIITSTDNIIDNENKGICFIKAIPDLVSNNIFNLMLHQNIIHSELNKLNFLSNSFNYLLEEIFFIAKSEGLRDASLYDTYPNSRFIEKNIHEGIGGKLLEISLVIPNIIENSSSLKHSSKALFEIGMALQALDDLTDLEEDKTNNKINLATAYLNENKSITSYLEDVLGRALKGFKILENLGYPITRTSAIHILKKLFKIRNIPDEYLNIFKSLK